MKEGAGGTEGREREGKGEEEKRDSQWGKWRRSGGRERKELREDTCPQRSCFVQDPGPPVEQLLGLPGDSCSGEDRIIIIHFSYKTGNTPTKNLYTLYKSSIDSVMYEWYSYAIQVILTLLNTAADSPTCPLRPTGKQDCLRRQSLTLE